MDHIGGLSAVITNFHPGELWVGLDPPTAAFRHLLEVAHAQNVDVLQHYAGDKVAFGGVTISVMAPASDYPLIC
jgi:beta-lactamase superfamily II metal-dependent hydrolase